MAIQTVELTNITGLPPSFSYACDPPTCIFPGGSSGCINIYSPSPTFSEIGSHQIIMNTTTTFGTGFFQPQNDIIDYYYININGSISSWDCDGQGNCLDPGTGNGTYALLSACQSNCIVVNPTWDCVSGVCVDLGLGTGIYSTQAACQNACIVVTPTWDCDGQGTCSDPGTGNGTYASLSACQANCNNVSVEEIGLTNFEIFPNPSSDLFNISFTSNKTQNLRVRILNILGEELINENLQQFVGEYTKQINLSNNAKGIYFLEIEKTDGIINKKLILQ